MSRVTWMPAGMLCFCISAALSADAAENPPGYKVSVELRVDKTQWESDEELTGVATATVTRAGSKPDETVVLNRPVAAIILSPAPPAGLLETKLDSAFPAKWTLGKTYESKFTIGRSAILLQTLRGQAKTIPLFKPGPLDLVLSLKSPHEFKASREDAALFGAFDSKKVSVTVTAKPLNSEALVELASATHGRLSGQLAEHLSWLGVAAPDLAPMFTPVERRLRLKFVDGTPFFARVKPGHEISVVPEELAGLQNLKVFGMNRVIPSNVPFTLTAPKSPGVYRADTDIPPRTLGWFLVE